MYRSPRMFSYCKYFSVSKSMYIYLIWIWPLSLLHHLMVACFFRVLFAQTIFRVFFIHIKYFLFFPSPMPHQFTKKHKKSWILNWKFKFHIPFKWYFHNFRRISLSSLMNIFAVAICFFFQCCGRQWVCLLIKKKTIEFVLISIRNEFLEKAK